MRKGCLVVLIFWGLLFFGGLFVALLGFAVTVLEVCFPILVIAALVYFIKWIIDYSNRYSPKEQSRPHNGGHRGSKKKKSKKNYDLNLK